MQATAYATENILYKGYDSVRSPKKRWWNGESSGPSFFDHRSEPPNVTD